MNLPLKNYLEISRQHNRKLLSLFLTAGFPTIEATLPLLQLLDAGGADLIELGIPFSDPLADGPTIQRSSQLTLQNGVTVQKVLELAGAAKSSLRSPMILMGYYNPILKFGAHEFVRAAAQAGVQGLIIPDLPPEESTALREAALTAGISMIYLVSPNTSPHRLALIDELTTSFIYAVSITGVTGARAQVANSAGEFLQRLKSATAHPVLVGFGVSNAEDARLLSSVCDGVIVGSALLNEIEKNGVTEEGKEKISGFVRELRRGLPGGNSGIEEKQN